MHIQLDFTSTIIMTTTNALFPCAVVPELLLALLSLRRASNSVSETQLPHTVRLNKEWTTRFASDSEDDDGKLSVFTSRERSGGRNF
ncbi:hypothetical protein T06_4111 [Trichinella sp. T6]|nr:hypothetical protein T06_4111 [Trichinella sp. T6]